MQSETNREEILEEDKYLSRFYYTFGSNSLGQQPFSFGHVLIYARSQLQAHIKFREISLNGDILKRCRIQIADMA